MPVLGGSWDLVNEVISTIFGVISIDTLFITLVTKSHDPSGKAPLLSLSQPHRLTSKPHALSQPRGCNPKPQCSLGARKLKLGTEITKPDTTKPEQAAATCSKILEGLSI